MRLLLAFIALLAGFNCSGQDSLLVTYLVERIKEQQIKEDKFFLPNIFPSYISNSNKFNNRKKDNNIFFTALINYNSSRLSHLLPINEQLKFDSIRNSSKAVFTYFKNKKGRETYNFWRTDTTYIFPYTKWIYRVKKNTALPDDLDDTVLSLWALNAPDSTARKVHFLMHNYANLHRNKVKSSLGEYQYMPAYSTWFGKNFPIVFDVCVLSNVLSFVQSYNLNWSQADAASLELITKTIKNKDHLKKPLLVSPYYGKTSIILYHLARLMSIRSIPELEVLKTSLIIDAANELGKTDNILEKIILCTAIMKWGYIPPHLALPSPLQVKSHIEENDLPFFIGNIPSYFPLFLKRLLYKKGWGLFYHYCPAYNDVLLLEYLLLKRSLTG